MICELESRTHDRTGTWSCTMAGKFGDFLTILIWPTEGRTLLAILLLVALGLVVRSCKAAGLPWRMAFLAGCTIWGSWLLFLTELLSPFQAITRGRLSFGWVLFCFLNLLWIWKTPARKEPSEAPGV